MTMDEKNNTRIVTLMELWDLLVQRLWVMVLVAAIAAGGLFLANKVVYVPEYASTATLYVLRQDKDTSNSDSDFSLALKVVNDCDYLLRSRSVLDEAIQDLNLDITYQSLRKRVSISNPDNTRILEVTVVADSPEQAKKIVDEICEVGQEKITEAMGFQQVRPYEYGTMDQAPCNKTASTTYLLVVVLAAIFTYFVFLMIFLLDDRIRTEEDIERYLGLSVLGEIPNVNGKRGHQYEYYAAYGAQKTKKG